MSEAVTLRVAHLMGQATVITDVYPDLNVRELKKLICDKSGVPIEQQLLIHKGRRMENFETLAQCGVTTSTTLYMSLNLRGD